MREKLFTVTAKDCKWSYTKGSGKGGQKRNKTSSAVHCIHEPSGARGYSEASRSQLDNKRDAFTKMANSDEFKKWLRIEIAKKNGTLLEIEDIVNRQMQNVKVEVRKDNKWVDENDSEN